MLKKAEFAFKHFENDPNMSFALLEEDPVTKRPVRFACYCNNNWGAPGAASHVLHTGSLAAVAGCQHHRWPAGWPVPPVMP